MDGRWRRACVRHSERRAVDEQIEVAARCSLLVARGSRRRIADASAAAFAAVRFQISTSAPASRSAQTTARAEPPAPRTQRSPAGGRAGERGDQPDGVGVLGRDPALGEAERVGGADRARRVGGRSASASAASLCGTVTLTPAKPSPASERDQLLEVSRRDLDRLVGPLAASPSSAQRRVLHRAASASARSGWPRTASRGMWRCSSSQGVSVSGRRRSALRRRCRPLPRRAA